MYESKMSIGNNDDNKYIPFRQWMKPEQNAQKFVNDIFNCIFLNKIYFVRNQIWPEFAPKGLIYDKWGLV